MISNKDREHLRTLAARQMDVAHSTINLERVALWKKHNALQGQRPMLHIETDTFEKEAIEPRLLCEDPIARELERDLYRAFLNLTQFDDDWVVPPYFGVQWNSYFHLFGHEIGRTNATDENGNDLGHQFNHIITDLEEDWGKLGKTQFGVDTAATQNYRTAAEECFGDILPVRMVMASPEAVPTQKIVHLMGMETMCYSMYDYPALFKQMMDRIATDYLAYYKFLEVGGYLLPTNGFELLRQGSKCFTAELPSVATTTKDTWGFMDSQESVSISPDMYGEFVFPCYNKIAQAFGLLSYGCCEPVDAVWSFVKTLPNLRKVSVSPWCSETAMAQNLQNSRIIFHRKPSPNFLGIGSVLDEDAFRAHIRATIQTAAGCKLEITQRDVYTIANDIGKVRRYVQIIREEIETHWKP